MNNKLEVQLTPIKVNSKFNLDKTLDPTKGTIWLIFQSVWFISSLGKAQLRGGW